MNKFTENRIAFVVSDGTIHVNDGEERTKPCLQWATESLDMCQNDWSQAIRGYFAEGRIQIFTGVDYHSVPPTLAAGIVIRLLKLYPAYYTETPRIYNGVVPGADGETWIPIEEITVTIE